MLAPGPLLRRVAMIAQPLRLILRAVGGRDPGNGHGRVGDAENLKGDVVGDVVNAQFADRIQRRSAFGALALVAQPYRVKAAAVTVCPAHDQLTVFNQGRPLLCNAPLRSSWPAPAAARPSLPYPKRKLAPARIRHKQNKLTLGWRRAALCAGLPAVGFQRFQMSRWRRYCRRTHLHRACLQVFMRNDPVHQPPGQRFGCLQAAPAEQKERLSPRPHERIQAAAVLRCGEHPVFAAPDSRTPRWEQPA